MGNNENKLKDIRVKEGLKVAELAKFSNVNEKTIRDIETGRSESTEVTKRKILIGLNNNPIKSRTWEYDEVFGSL